LRKKCDLNFIQVPKTTQEEKMERVEGWMLKQNLVSHFKLALLIVCTQTTSQPAVLQLLNNFLLHGLFVGVVCICLTNTINSLLKHFRENTNYIFMYTSKKSSKTNTHVEENIDLCISSWWCQKEK
jgi:hypothetical protein